MITAKLMKIAACIAWVGAGVSSAAPVQASAATMSSGTYANCSNRSSPTLQNLCGIQFNYQQTMRFVGVACNAGGCSDELGITYTESVYAAGRKIATPAMLHCQGSYSVYGLDACAC
jgi:hypothetical protein